VRRIRRSERLRTPRTSHSTGLANLAGVILASIPSPSSGVLNLGPLPIRAYALCIIAGIVVAVVVGDRRLVARGGPKGAIAEIATWAVPAGLIGARLYHLATNPELYWGKHGQGTAAALEVWHGGLGIWGGVLGGAVGAWIACRRRGIPLALVADALAPGLVLAQAVGRWGNYFNQELFGRPTSLPWGLEISPSHRPPGYEAATTFHPTFLYESLWDVFVALLVIWLDRRLRLTGGRAFALYVAAYTLGRFWIESLRIDDAHKFLGLRLNDWTSVVVFAGAIAFLLLRRGPEPVDGDAETMAPDEAGHTLSA
jgi:prolipoprotein diacylglyceryl transferase